MNKILILLLVSCFVVSGIRGEEKKFVINGNIPEVTEGRILVLTESLQGVDTLGSAVITNGVFKVEGVLEQPVVASLVLENYKGGFMIILEPEVPYKVELYSQEASQLQGGKLQQALLDYQESAGNANRKIQELTSRIEEAGRKQHFKTVSELRVQLNELRKTSREELEQIIRPHEDNVFAAYVRTVGLEGVKDVQVLKGRYAQLSEKARQTLPGKKLAARIAMLEKVTVAAIAPNFTLPAPDGEALSLYDVKGKMKIIDFWASWCGPCRMENPNMVALYKEYKDKGLVIISVSLDEKKEAWQNAIQKDGMPWVHLSSLKGWTCKVVQQYGVDAVPFIFVLDENNHILAKQLRGEKLREFVAERLK